MSFSFPPPRPRRDRKRGQTAVEFALVAPLVFFLLFGIIEFGLMTFDIGTSRFADSEAARAIAAGGDSFNLCQDVTGCTRLHAALSQCDADCQALVAINNTALGGTRLARVNYVEITKLDPTTGNPTATMNHYTTWSATGNDFSGSVHTTFSYAALARGVTAGSTDYVSVRINFTYVWLMKMFAAIAPSPTLDAIYFIHLEPRRF